MADAVDVRRSVSTLPGVVEVDSDGFDFRVGGKGFVWSYPERVPGRPRCIRTDVAVLFVGDEAEKQALLLGEPDLFFTSVEYDGAALVLLRLPAVEPARLTELVTDAWRMRRGLEPGPAAGSAPTPAPVVRRPPPAHRATPTTGPEPLLQLDFRRPLTYWRGPAPHHFVAVPDDACRRIAAAAAAVTYGWGMIPVSARIGSTVFTTSLWPKDGGYLLPVKKAVRVPENLQLDDVVEVHLDIAAPGNRVQESR